MSSSDSAGLSTDQIFEILSSQRRRMVLYYLRQHGGSATMSDLADQIAAWENETEIDELTSQERKRVYVSLYQTHLPKLASTNLIDYDSDEGDVRLTDRATEMDAFLSPKQRSGYSWRRHYFALLLLAGALMVIGVIVTPLFGPNVLPLLVGGILIGYLVTVGVEYWYHRKQQSTVPVELVPDDQ
ncbi:DUF7344 domain-containing protein [Halodesulfurarchaeum formicicum]|uniref:DUF7344 domain-containing protein n=2 Tax=Halodesulfurarchaeum formicicum TaxID=1873524 RepID=A0A1J1AAA9_9EURY|nr:hypothetical protein HSR6_0616 [Halodesulfurarchaeum formicicum]